MSCQVWGNEFNFRCKQWADINKCVSANVCKHMPKTMTTTRTTANERSHGTTVQKKKNHTAPHITNDHTASSTRLAKWTTLQWWDEYGQRQTERKEHMEIIISRAIGMKSPMKCMQIWKNELLIGSFYRFMCHIKTINSHLSKRICVVLFFYSSAILLNQCAAFYHV